MSLEERLTNLEQTIERRLAVTERVIGQLLTGQADENLETLDVLTLRSGSAYVAHSSLKLRFLPTNPPVRAVLVHAQQGLTKPTPPKETITTQRMASSLPPSQGSICYWVIVHHSADGIRIRAGFKLISSSRRSRLQLSNGHIQHQQGACGDSALWVLGIRRLSTAFSPVMFSAYKSSRESDISTKVTIRFDGTYINPGNHYHTEDGIFIAPVTGVYMFHWVIVNNKSSFTTQLMVAGTPRASNLIPFPGGRDSSSAMVIISVNKDDHVWIQIYGSSVYVFGGGTSYNNHQSTFTGILLQKA
uniref:Complement C1q tumor necrosis factor-related protein 2 n=1 Tax=Magallana gigas TaxID=29159 RepID=K1PCH6_MAGGI